MIKVGDTIFFKEKHAVLFQTATVHGETSRSWLCLYPGNEWMRTNLDRYARKLPKSLKGYVLGTEESAKLAHWVLDHRHNIGSVVQGQSADMILKIAQMIGYKELP